ncbi:S-adenosyl-L-methionine-dependent methyltransferase [Biscogniauxia marginata]|nr:S-adenosyl-L-methionine-dependent methyltransferase [Biscogniauxia marginata]
MLPTLRQRIDSWVEPASLLTQSAHWCPDFFIVLAERCARAGPFRLSSIRDEAFSRFWVDFTSPKSQEAQSPADQPRDSAILIPPLLSAASGIVLDIGPGSGTQIPLLAKHADQISHIYGAEPSLALHKALSTSLTQNSLEEKYTIMACSAETTTLMPAITELVLESPQKPDLGTVDVRNLEIFDTIICLRVLCSVESPKQTIQGLYNVLKPGGKMIICEHTVNPWRTAKGSVFARLLQILYTLCGWKFFMGNCHMDRDTRAFLMDAAKEDGGWDAVDLEYNFCWKPVPYLSGVLIKKGYM